MRRPSSALCRLALSAAAVTLASPVLLYGILALPSPIRVELGPNDRDYAQGLPPEWGAQGGTTWREMGRRARLHLPVVLEGTGTLILSVARPDPSPVRLRAQLDGGTSREITIPFSREFRDVRIEVATSPARASIRLRTDTETGAPGRLKIASFGLEGFRVRPQIRLLGSGALVFGLTFLALVTAGSSGTLSLAATGCLAAVLFLLGAGSPLTAIHLIQRGPMVAGAGLAVVGLARCLSSRWTPAFLSVVYLALLLKSFLVFHPRFYFVDLPIHETLLELVYHRGVIDFWQRFPDYQVKHNLGVAPVADVQQPFPYPVAFYLLAHMGNRLAHDPVLWLKLTGALVATGALFPIGYLARRFSPAPGVDVLAAFIYLVTPAYTRSLFLLELSALTGHLFDLIVMAYLAGILLDLQRWKRVMGTAALIAASTAAYTSGFVHQGLFVGSCLLLAPWIEGLDGRGRLRLAGAALLGGAVGLAFYHPQTVTHLFLAVLPAGMATDPSAAPSLAERLVSAMARLREFLGPALPLIGGVAVAYVIGRASPHRSLRLLLAAWTLAAAVAYGLRFILLELFHYQKELYWLGGLLVFSSAVLAARLQQTGRWGRLGAVLLLVILTIAGLWAFTEMLPRFYGNYVFL